MKKVFLLLAFVSLALAGCKKGGDNLPELPEPTTGDRAEINGTIWATCNVGAPGTFATKPEDFGMLYQWGVRVGWSAADPLVSSPAGRSWATEMDMLEITEWSVHNDPCPGSWRVPTIEEFETLAEAGKVTRKWGKVEGVTGISFTDATTGDSIFFPTTKEARDEQGVMHYEYSGYSGVVWSSTKYNDVLMYALMFDKDSGRVDTDMFYSRENGKTVRCVAK